MKPKITVINIYLPPQKSHREMAEEAVRRYFGW
jgi:hypothetical protein